MGARAAEGMSVVALLSPPLPALAVPDERRGLPVPGPGGLLERGADLSAGLRGCWPSRVRRLRLRWMDAARVSQLPPSGVGSGMTPRRQSQTTISGVLWPARLSH